MPHAHGCTGHSPVTHAAHRGCCAPDREDKLTWLERRLEGLQKEAQAVEEQIDTLRQEQDEQA